MPNRILKESICYSEDLDKLKTFEEIVFYRLIVNCDDYGRIDARPSFLKSKLFVTRQGITLQNIDDAIRKLASVGLVKLYEVDKKPFLLFPKWEFHQVIRAKKSRYPAPDDICKQMISDDGECLRNPIQSESESNPNPNICTELQEPPRSISAVIELPLNDKTFFAIFQVQIDEWVQLYPNADIIQELRKMRGWLDANPTKRKTQRGILRFIIGWLSKAQDKSNPKTYQQNQPKTLTQRTFEELKEVCAEYDRRNA